MQAAFKAAGASTIGLGQRILVADDDPGTLHMLVQCLSAAGFEVLAAQDGPEAISLMSGDITAALLDFQMPGASGLDCLRHARQHWRDMAVLIVSGTGAIQDAVAAMREGALDYLTKPVDGVQLIARMKHACWSAQLARDNRGLREAVTAALPACDFVARAPAATEVLRQTAKVAPLDSTVLITGESGTGKTMLARIIHQTGPRAAGPFVVFNCASLPRDLVEAELFGHVKGAFTGAMNDRPGRAEIADGGTLFLDEIGDLPLELQPKLLTFLQEHTFHRIGSNKLSSVNVRVITATHQDLPALCRDKRFREDLYFRLSVITLHIPALRERMEDLPDMAAQILHRLGQRHGLPPLTLDPAALEALKRHAWRGNVRELENVLERAAVFCEGPLIGTQDLRLPRDGAAALAPSGPASLAGRTLDDLEKQALLDTLEACGGNKAEAARRLGISDKSVYNKLKRLGLSLESSTL